MTERIILLVPRAAPDSGARWSNPRPRRVALTGEDADAWYGAPTDNPACPPLTWPRFAWEEVAPTVSPFVRRAQSHELPASDRTAGR